MGMAVVSDVSTVLDILSARYPLVALNSGSSAMDLQ